ncbi:MAG: RNA-processing protein, partial [Thermoplasmata archaeon]|nr:RNA-processing protein [Thermoplasmata archaeon]
MIYCKVPKERIAVIIGSNGEVRKKIEDYGGIRLIVGSDSGEVVVNMEEAEDPVMGLKAADVVKAIARGFTPDQALRLFGEEMYLTIIDVRDFAGKGQKRIRQVRARVIGRRGKTRELIEELTGADVSVYGNTISVIGDVAESPVAVRAITMLLEGSEHSSVYHYLEG